MIKIGLIDYYLDNFHAMTYCTLLGPRSAGECKVCCAWGELDNTFKSGGLTNKEWAEKYGIELLSSQEEVIEKSDCLIVLAPNDPETHERLVQKAFRSGKPVYVDKTFAPDKASALRMLEIADSHGTKCYSSSALRFSEEYGDIVKADIDKLYSEGPGEFKTYCIHQIEPIVQMMECSPKRLMNLGDYLHPSILIEFEDGRTAQFYHRTDELSHWRMSFVDKENKAIIKDVASDYYSLFIDSLIEFFKTGIVPVPHKQTVDIISIREAAIKSLDKPFEWVEA